MQNMTRLILCVLFLTAPATAEQDLPPQTELEGQKSLYTPLLVQLTQSWPPKDVTYLPKSEQTVQMRCLSTPGDEFYVGVEQWMMIQAPFERVEAVLDDIDDFENLFPDLAEVKVTQRRLNQLTTYWEQKIPLFFVPNAKFEMNYLISKLSKDRKAYRYQLKDGRGNLKYDDGMIVIERLGKNLTRYTEYDFWASDSGMFRSLGVKKVWSDSLEGIYVSDAAIKLKAESQGMSSKDALEQAKKLGKGFSAEECLKNRRPFSLLERTH